MPRDLKSLKDVSKITSVDLSEVQLAYLRELVFRELREAARALAEQADLAADESIDENIAGDDAHSAWRHRVQFATELLDKIGWSVLTDKATMLADERARRAEDARYRSGRLS